MDDPDARFHWTDLDPGSPMTPTVPRDLEEALEMALTLAVVALKDDQSEDCMTMAMLMAERMELEVVERVKEKADYNSRMLMVRYPEIFEGAAS